MRLSVYRSTSFEQKALEVEKREFNPAHLSEEFIQAQCELVKEELFKHESYMDDYLLSKELPEYCTPFSFEGKEQHMLCFVEHDWEEDPDLQVRIHFNEELIKKFIREGAKASEVSKRWSEYIDQLETL